MIGDLLERLKWILTIGLIGGALFANSSSALPALNKADHRHLDRSEKVLLHKLKRIKVSDISADTGRLVRLDRFLKKGIVDKGIHIDIVFKNKLLDVTTRLHNLGVSEIGNFSLDEFQRRLEGIQFYAVRPTHIVTSGDFRKFGINLRRNKLVIINEAYRMALDDKAFLLGLLHEALDVTGYPDVFYELSTALYHLYLLKSPEHVQSIIEAVAPFLDKKFPVPTDNRNIQIAGDGGASGVGGGGDSEHMIVKNDILKMIDSTMVMIKEDFPYLTYLSKAQIIRDFLEAKVVLDNEGPYGIIEGDDGRLIILFPTDGTYEKYRRVYVSNYIHNYLAIKMRHTLELVKKKLGKE